MNRHAFFDELSKLGMITPQHAEASLERLQSLEDSQPTMGQALRYGLAGALAGPAATGISDAIKGQKIFRPAEVAGKTVPFGRGRAALASAAAGALTGGALPFLRNRLDRAAEMQTLRRFLQQPVEEKQAMRVKLEGDAVIEVDKKGKSLGKGNLLKEGDFEASYDPGNFKVSPYSGPMSYGPWVLASLLSGGDDQPLDATIVRKKVAGALTPVGATPKARLTAGQNVAQPKVSGPSAPGGSIADIAKPRGFGVPMPGALKETI